MKKPQDQGNGGDKGEARRAKSEGAAGQGGEGCWTETLRGKGWGREAGWPTPGFAAAEPGLVFLCG